MSWFKEGSDGWGGHTAEKKSIEEDRARRVWRFWQPRNSTAKITILDNPYFFAHEHNVQVGGKFGNFYTCKAPAGEHCLVCDYDNGKPSYCLFFSVIDHSLYTTKKGKRIQHQKKLFAAKAKVIDVIKRRIESLEGDIKGCVFEVSRGSGDKECATGEDIVYTGKRLNEDQLLQLGKKIAPEGISAQEYISPFDYPKILAPKSDEVISSELRIPLPMGSDQGSYSGLNDTDDSTGIDDLL